MWRKSLYWLIDWFVCFVHSYRDIAITGVCLLDNWKFLKQYLTAIVQLMFIEFYMIGRNSVLSRTFICQKCLGQLTIPLVIVTDLAQFHGTVFVCLALSQFSHFFLSDFQFFRPEYHWRDLISPNAHLVHQNWYRVSFTLQTMWGYVHRWRPTADYIIVGDPRHVALRFFLR
jgi:hypothetical protein